MLKTKPGTHYGRAIVITQLKGYMIFYRSTSTLGPTSHPNRSRASWSPLPRRRDDPPPSERDDSPPQRRDDLPPPRRNRERTRGGGGTGGSGGGSGTSGGSGGSGGSSTPSSTSPKPTVTSDPMPVTPTPTVPKVTPPSQQSTTVATMSTGRNAILWAIPLLAAGIVFCARRRALASATPATPVAPAAVVTP
jgi:hypothetical protein